MTFPKVRFPYMAFERENGREEERVLKEVAAAFKAGTCAGVLVEPITQQGNMLASPTFYLSLQDLCHSHGASFILDETNTALGASGLFWAYEHWGPRASPDILIFGGHMQASGFFSPHSFRPFCPPSCADLPSLALLSALRKVIHSHHLQKNAEFIGKYVKTRLESITSVSNVRGQGLLLAFDLPSEAAAQRVWGQLAKVGVVLPALEGKTITLRPSLVLGVEQAGVFIRSLEFAVSGEVRLPRRLASAA